MMHLSIIYLDPIFRAAAFFIEAHYLLLHRLNDASKYDPKSPIDVFSVIC